MENVKALFFDVGGTVFDWKFTVRERIAALATDSGQTIDSEAFANDWRGAMFRIHTRVGQGDLPWMNSDAMLRRALEELAADYPLITTIDRDALVKATWHGMKPFAGAPAAIDRLRTRFTVVVLTILSWESIVNSSKAAGVCWDGILSCEFLGHYKPSLQAYLAGTRLLGLPPAEACMVAAHAGDLAAARAAGLHTAYVGVPATDNDAEGFGSPIDVAYDIEALDFEDLCRRLSV
jgi:2-haloacid dehalogenase